MVKGFYSPTAKTYCNFSVLVDQSHKRVRWQMLRVQLRVRMKKEETMYKWPQFLSIKLISDINFYVKNFLFCVSLNC